MKYIILGSGIGGLAAGAELKKNGQNFCIVEREEELPRNLHNGVHYLHDISFDPPFEFPFKSITLTEEIWRPGTSNGAFKKIATLEDSIDYSMKTMQIRHPSSIMNIGKRDSAYVPESNNMNDLLEDYYSYIGGEKFMFSTKCTRIMTGKKTVELTTEQGSEEIEYDAVISTVPLDTLGYILDENPDFGLTYEYQPLHITNFIVKNIVPNWMINIYIPSKMVKPYRVSILNGIMSVESTEEMNQRDLDTFVWHISEYFDIDKNSKHSYIWKTGKIVSISKDERSQVIDYFANKSIYTIGRFGLWNRKLLMHSTAIQAKKIVNYLTSTNKDATHYRELKSALIS